MRSPSTSKRKPQLASHSVQVRKTVFAMASPSERGGEAREAGRAEVLGERVVAAFLDDREAHLLVGAARRVVSEQARDLRRLTTLSPPGVERVLEQPRHQAAAPEARVGRNVLDDPHA